MDTSEIYIKMCEKAVGIQALRQWSYFDNSLFKETRQGNYEEGDYIWADGEIYLIGGDCYDISEGSKYGLKISSAGYCEGDDFNVKKVIWLPRQDELQEMINFRPNGIYGFWEFIRGEWNPYSESYDTYLSEYLTSMEQLWLAFVMKEKYNKIWNGEDWVE